MHYLPVILAAFNNGGFLIKRTTNNMFQVCGGKAYTR